MTKKIQANCDYYWPIVIEFYFSLIDKNFYYEMVNEDTLDKRDLATTEYIPYSGDTKDKYLKHIRQ